MITYDRTVLTKNVLTADANKLVVRDGDFLKSGDIDFKLGKRVETVDTKSKELKFSDGSSLVRHFL
jgi:NAD(P)H-nitrite reductase large subunit